MKYNLSLKSLLKEFLGYRKNIILGNILAIGATTLTVLIPLFIPILVDELLLGKNHHVIEFIKSHFFELSLSGYVFLFLIITLFLRALGVFFAIWQNKLFIETSKSITYKLRIKAIDHLKRVRLKEYEEMESGGVVSRLISDIDTIDNFIGVTISKLIVSILVLLFTSIVLIIINWKLALFIILTNPIVVYFTAKMARRVGFLKREENRAIEKFSELLNGVLTLFWQIRASNKEDYFFDRVKKRALLLRDKAIDFAYRSDRAIRVSFLIFLSGYELFRSMGILAVAYSNLSIGLMLAIFGYLWIMMTPTQDIINFQYALANAKSAIKRVNEIFDLPIEKSGNKDPFFKDVEIKGEDIRFRYEDKDILKGVSFYFKPKGKIAIVGPSGSGKTTLANLLVGFYMPDSGKLKYNQIDIKDINLKVLREKVHLILQSPKLFNDTMRFNLTLGKSFSQEEIKKAIKLVNLDTLIASMPHGLDTKIGRDGIKLSGGQRQRVAIARMILQNPQVVIFDESTSALDYHSEEQIFKNLEEFLRDKMVIIIAHRLSTIEKCEDILVLEDGVVKDFGSWDELRKKEEGYFAQMI